MVSPQDQVARHRLDTGPSPRETWPRNSINSMSSLQYWDQMAVARQGEYPYFTTDPAWIAAEIQHRLGALQQQGKTPPHRNAQWGCFGPYM